MPVGRTKIRTRIPLAILVGTAAYVGTRRAALSWLEGIKELTLSTGMKESFLVGAQKASLVGPGVQERKIPDHLGGEYPDSSGPVQLFSNPLVKAFSFSSRRDINLSV